MRLVFLGVACLLAACAPNVPSSGGSGSSGATGSTSGGSSSVGDTAQDEDEDEDEMGSTSFGPRYDIASGEPVDVCGFTRPTVCDRTWPPEEELASGWTDTHVVPGPGSAYVSYTDDPSPDALQILSVAFDLPCASSSGVPKAPTTRYQLDAEVTQWDFGGFEWSQQSTYPARIDVELLSECLHLQVHAIEVTDDQPLDGLGDVFEWHDLLRPGYVHAPW